MTTVNQGVTVVSTQWGWRISTPFTEMVLNHEEFREVIRAAYGLGLVPPRVRRPQMTLYGKATYPVSDFHELVRSCGLSMAEINRRAGYSSRRVERALGFDYITTSKGERYYQTRVSYDVAVNIVRACGGDLVSYGL
jgi:hypothetical protein